LVIYIKLNWLYIKRVQNLPKDLLRDIQKQSLNDGSCFYV